jgi:hypothetical protein
MEYITASHWTGSEINDEMIKIAQEKFVPVFMSVDASSVQTIRTSE